MFDFVNTETLGTPVTESYISEVEKQFGVRFPEILKQYYLKHNGRKMRRIRLLIDGETYTVDRISALGSKGLSLEELLDRQRLQDFPVRQMLPFAEDQIDGIYYLHTGTGMVWFSTLEGEDDFLPVCRGVGRFFQILDAVAGTDGNEPYDVAKHAGAERVEREDLLPLGTVVELPETSCRIMIIARAVRVSVNETDYYYDYGGVVYPDGHDGARLAYFNRKDIEKVCFYGYKGDEDDAVQTAVKRFLDTHPNINIGNNGIWDGKA